MGSCSFGREVNKTAVAESRSVTEQNVCPAPGHPGDTCGAGVSGTGAGQINAARPPIALDSSGHLWVGDEKRLEKFNADGAFTGTPVTPSGTRRRRSRLASSGDFYVLRSASAQKLRRVYATATGTEVGTRSTTSAATRRSRSTAPEPLRRRPPSGGAQAVFREFNPAGVQIEQFGSGQVFGTAGPEGIAIGNTAEALYSNSEALPGTLRRPALRPSQARFPLPGNERTEGILPTEATLKPPSTPRTKKPTTTSNRARPTAPELSRPRQDSRPRWEPRPSFEGEKVEAPLTN